MNLSHFAKKNHRMHNVKIIEILHSQKKARNLDVVFFVLSRPSGAFFTLWILNTTILEVPLTTAFNKKFLNVQINQVSNHMEKEES